MSAFSFVDSIAELKKNESITALYELKGEEEFLEDHFRGFPVMPGVLLLESLAQAAAKLLAESDGGGGKFYRIVWVEGVRFGQFVKPGTKLKIFARLLKQERGVSFLEGRIDLMEPESDGGHGPKALSASLALQPLL